MDVAEDSSVATLSSNDNGATFNSTTVVFDPHHDGLQAQDVKRVGDNVYVLYTAASTIPEGPDAGAATTNLGFAVSTNGGMSFVSQVISEPAGDGYPQTQTLQDQHYVPKMAVVGDNIYVTWTGLDGGDVMSLFYRRSTDNGVTFEPTVNLSRNALPAERTPRWGLETIAAKADYVYVVFVTTDAWLYMRRSTDGGATFQGLQLLSAPSGVPYIGGGWWPVVETGPTDPTGATVHVLWTRPTYVYSSNGGATFTGPVLLSPQFSWLGDDPRRPHMAIGDDGAVHWVAAGSLPPCCPDSDIFYRRYEPNPPAPSAANMALRLVSNQGSDGNERYDNMQVPASSDINFTSAMTVEAWIKPNKVSSTGYFVYKAEPGEGGSWGSYMLGQSDTRADARIATTDGGFVLVAGDPIPNGVWSHVAMTYDANAGADNFRLYVNGILAGSMTATGTLKTNKGILFVGGDWMYRYYDDVTVDELRFWNRALTASDILANMEQTLQGNEPGLAAYYSFDGTTLDMTGHGNDGVFMYKERFVEDAPLGSHGLTNLSLLPEARAGASSIYSGGYPADRIKDGNLNTSWFSAIGDAANMGSSPWAEVGFPMDVTVSQVTIRGNREYADGFDIFAGRIDLFDAQDNLLYTQDVELPGPTRDLDIPLGTPLGGVRRVRFTSTRDESNEPGFSELEVIGPITR